MKKIEAYKSYDGNLYQRKDKAMVEDLKKIIATLQSRLENYSNNYFFYKKASPDEFDKGEFNYDFTYEDVRKWVNKVLDEIEESLNLNQDKKENY